MQLIPIHTGNFKLDGGAMFGVVPKSIWNKAYAADENNLINLAMRCICKRKFKTGTVAVVFHRTSAMIEMQVSKKNIRYILRFIACFVK